MFWLIRIIRTVHSVDLRQSIHCNSHNICQWTVLCPRGHERTGSARPNCTSYAVRCSRSIQLFVPLRSYLRSLLSRHMDGGTNPCTDHDIRCILRIFCWSFRLPHYAMHCPNIWAQGDWNEYRHAIYHHIYPVSPHHSWKMTTVSTQLQQGFFRQSHRWRHPWTKWRIIHWTDTLWRHKPHFGITIHSCFQAQNRLSLIRACLIIRCTSLSLCSPVRSWHCIVLYTITLLYHYYPHTYVLTHGLFVVFKE